jgi:hypothetical protein
MNLFRIAECGLRNLNLIVQNLMLDSNGYYSAIRNPKSAMNKGYFYVQ